MGVGRPKLSKKAQWDAAMALLPSTRDFERRERPLG